MPCFPQTLGPSESPSLCLRDKASKSLVATTAYLSKAALPVMHKAWDRQGALPGAPPTSLQRADGPLAHAPGPGRSCPAAAARGCSDQIRVCRSGPAHGLEQQRCRGRGQCSQTFFFAWDERPRPPPPGRGFPPPQRPNHSSPAAPPARMRRRARLDGAIIRVAAPGPVYPARAALRDSELHSLPGAGGSKNRGFVVLAGVSVSVSACACVSVSGCACVSVPVPQGSRPGP